MKIIHTSILALFFCLSSRAEDGSTLWFRYAAGPKVEINCREQLLTLNIAVSELQKYWIGLPMALDVNVTKELRALGNEGHTIRFCRRQANYRCFFR